MNASRFFRILALGLACNHAAAQFGADECSAADDVTGMVHGSIPLDTNACSDTGAAATAGGEQPCNLPSTDVWFRFDASVGHMYRIDTCNTVDFWAQTSVWDDAGGGCAGLVPRGCSDSSPGCVDSGILRVPAQQSSMYVQVGGLFGQLGSGTLQIADLGPPQPCSPTMEDGLEDNDDCASARPIAVGSYSGLYISQTDPDFYTFEVPVGHTVSAAARTAFEDGQIGMLLKDASCQLISLTASGTSDTSPLTWLNDTVAQRTVVLQLSMSLGNFQHCNLYDLDIAVVPDFCTFAPDDAFEDNDSCAAAPTLAEGVRAGLLVRSGDPDYYRFVVPAGEAIEVTVDHPFVVGHLTAELWNEDCSSFLSGGRSGFAGWRNDTGAPVTVVARVRVPGSATYECLVYDLAVEIGTLPCDLAGPDAFEENDLCSEPLELGDGCYAGLNVTDEDRDFYRIVVAPGASATVDAYFSHADANVDVYGYLGIDDCTVSSNTGEGGASLDDDETLVLSNPDRVHRTFLVDVHLGWGLCASYDLEINGAGTLVGTHYCQANPTAGTVPARISAIGSVAVDDQDLTLLAERLPTDDTVGLFLFGSNPLQVPFGDGFRCVGGQVRRVQPPVQASPARAASRQLDFGAGYAEDLVAGAQLYFQFWFRTPAAASEFNLTDGLSILFR